jgi:predicted transcriptional regulator
MPDTDREDADRTGTSAGDGREEVDLETRDYGIYRCGECGNVVLSMQDNTGEMSCHGNRMERITEPQLSIRPPDIRQVLLDAFGLPKAGLDICLCVISDGPMSPQELATRLGYDEATVRKYLNELVEFGLLNKSQLNRESGGYVHVYHSIDIERMREETLVGFYAWAGEAASLIEEANLTKEEYLDANDEQSLNDIFWDSFATE